jgi:aryl-alcohol dehydrogenase-like predicted oxidoreductase
MRRVTLGRTGIETSSLGFGCASLGSRVGAAEGALALAAAFEGGVTWIDLAPVYGDGRAEAIAAAFLRAHRRELQICTKAGLGLAAGTVGLRRALAPLARRVIAAAGPMGPRLRRAAPRPHTRLPLSPDLLRRSLEGSLRRLGTDHVDLFALHNPAPEEVARPDTCRALEEILAAGKARAVAVAGDAAAAGAALAQGAPYGVIQLAQPEPAAPPGPLAAARDAGFGVITHSVFGAEGPWEALGRRIRDDPDFAARVAAAGGGGEPGAALARILMDRAFAANPDGVVLVSMFSAHSRQANLAAAGRTPGPGDPLGALLAGA